MDSSSSSSSSSANHQACSAPIASVTLLYGPAHFVMTCSGLYRTHNYSTSLSRVDIIARRIEFCVRWSHLHRLSPSGRRVFKAPRPGVASRLLYGGRDQTASRTGHTRCACTLRAPQRATMSQVCPGGLGQAPAMCICSRWTTHGSNFVRSN
jgi:hypothetical protein